MLNSYRIHNHLIIRVKTWKLLLFGTCLFFLLAACTSTKKRIGKQLKSNFSTSFYNHQFTGVLIIDAETKDTIYNLNSAKYFTPASNTKIFTLYTALQSLPERIPALRYITKNDTLFFEGTGDPSLLYPYFQDSTTIQFLRKYPNLVYASNNFLDSKYGPGWAWEDFLYYYSPERNALPVHGNVLLSYKNPDLQVTPSYFADSVLEISHKENRNRNKNLFFYPPESRDTLEIPFIVNTQSTLGILEKEIHKKIEISNNMPLGEKQTLYGIKSDSLYTRMMHESDNFIAEQLLILSASTLTDSLDSHIARTHILENQLNDLKQQPRWVDGSGLSRYNLFTPQNMVAVLDKLYQDISRERLFSIFPAGGISGTLKNRFKGEREPYLFAKSGSLSNNYCLSGYLVTNSGKTLIFSFMNNHFKQSTSEERLYMERIFKLLRDTY